MKTDMPMLKKRRHDIKGNQLMQKTGIPFVSVVDGIQRACRTICPKDIIKAFQVPSMPWRKHKNVRGFFCFRAPKKCFGCNDCSGNLFRGRKHSC